VTLPIGCVIRKSATDTREVLWYRCVIASRPRPNPIDAFSVLYPFADYSEFSPFMCAPDKVQEGSAIVFERARLTTDDSLAVPDVNLDVEIKFDGYDRTILC